MKNLVLIGCVLFSFAGLAVSSDEGIIEPQFPAELSKSYLCLYPQTPVSAIRSIREGTSDIFHVIISPEGDSAARVLVEWEDGVKITGVTSPTDMLLEDVQHNYSDEFRISVKGEIRPRLLYFKKQASKEGYHEAQIELEEFSIETVNPYGSKVDSWGYWTSRLECWPVSWI